MYVEVKGFLFESDKSKMKNVLKEHDIDFRIAFKEDIGKLVSEDDLKNLHSFLDEIDYSMFKNYWELEGNWNTFLT